MNRRAKPATTPKFGSYHERAKLVSSEQHKFNVVIYGIKEYKKGTPRHVRMSNDIKSASEIICHLPRYYMPSNT